MQTRSRHACWGGEMGFYAHPSEATGTTMRFSVFVPPQAKAAQRPTLYYLAGLTCTEETFALKAGAQRYAAEHGLVLVAPDTSPRGLGLPGETESWDFGEGAGFYLDATTPPWSDHYRMARYVGDELPALIEREFPVTPGRRGLFGHSMGGHGALVTALRDPSRWHSLSAFAPIANPVAVPWGQKAFSRYLGPDQAAWSAWDASLLMRDRPYPGPILVDQGLDDQFLADQLRPEALEQAAAASGQKLTLRHHRGYDHSYWFIQSFMADHLAHHARALLTALLLLVSLPALAAGPLQFWNLTGTTVTDLRLAPAGSDRFGPNQCANDKDGTVDNDERLKLTGVEPGRYDVRVGLQGGRICTVRGVTLKGTGKYAFSLEPGDLKDCRSP